MVVYVIFSLKYLRLTKYIDPYWNLQESVSDRLLDLPVVLQVLIDISPRRILSGWMSTCYSKTQINNVQVIAIASSAVSFWTTQEIIWTPAIVRILRQEMSMEEMRIVATISMLYDTWRPHRSKAKTLLSTRGRQDYIIKFSRYISESTTTSFQHKWYSLLY